MLYCSADQNNCITLPQSDTAWKVTSASVPASEAASQCISEFGSHHIPGFPRNAHSMEYLKNTTSGEEAWIGLELISNTPDTLCLVPSSPSTPPVCVLRSEKPALTTWEKINQITNDGVLGYSFLEGAATGFICSGIHDSVYNLSEASLPSWALSALCKAPFVMTSTSAIILYGVTQGVYYGAYKTGLVSEKNANRLGMVAGIVTNAATRATYWGVAEMVVQASAAAVGYYCGESLYHLIDRERSAPHPASNKLEWTNRVCSQNPDERACAP